jgi:hypothetical protein
MKKILIILFLIVAVSIFSSSLSSDYTHLLKSIHSSQEFNNIYPYPLKNEDSSEMGWGYFYQQLEPFWYVIGKYESHWSDLENGLYLSNSLPYVTGLTSGFNLDKVRLIFGIYTFDPFLTDEEILVQKDGSIDQNSDRRRYPENGYIDPFKAFFIHRIDILPFKNLRLSFSEINLVGGKFGDVVDFNPLGVTHNTFGEGFSNAMLGIDASWNPIKGFQLYGQFALDDYVVPATEAGAINYKPTGLAWGYGARAVFKMNDFYIAPKAEYYKIYTWMYNRWQTLLTFTGRYDGIDYPMGFKHGANMEGYLIGLDIFNNKGKYKVLFENYIKGDIDIDTPYDDPRKPLYEEYPWEGPAGELRKIIKVSFIFEFNI